MSKLARLVCVLLWSQTASAQCSKPEFAAARLFLAGQDSAFATIADLNGDGINDAVVVNNSANTISVLLGNGDGTLQSAVNYVTGDNPASVTVADFNGDGVPDLAVSVEGSTFPVTDAHVAILLGNGDGTFHPALTIATSGFGQIAAGDFNGDHKLDLVIGQANLILLGNGDGTFKAPVSFSLALASSYPGIAVGDFNQDGKLDLAVSDTDPATLIDQVQVLLGNGDGTFRSPAGSFPVGKVPVFLAAADVNADGQLDLVTANSADGTVSVLLGNGNGTFAPAVTYNTGPPENVAVVGDFSSVAVGDFNGDGFPDLAVPGQAIFPGTGYAAILLNNGDGSFKPPVDYSPGGSGVRFIAAGDVNGDGTPDLLVVTGDSSANVAVILANGDGTFQTAPRVGAGQVPNSVVTGDFNGDSVPDLAVANAVSNDVSVLLGHGDGTFQPAVSYPVGNAPLTVAVADFNSDGKLDLAVANVGSHSVSVLLGNGDGTFRPPVNSTVPGAVSLAVGDFNKDGKPDLIVSTMQGTTVLIGNGDGSFQTGGTYGTGSGGSFVVADLNGDGNLDFAINNFSSNTVSVFLGNGDGSFKTNVDYTADNVPQSIAVGDFNGDGKLDLAVANLVCNPCYSPDSVGDVSVLLGNGDGTFQGAVNYPGAKVPQFMTAGDFNGDGVLDLALASPLPQAASVMLGNGDGSFQPPLAFGAGGNPTSVAVGDFNGDGKPDLAVANSFAGVSILLNTCPAN